MNFEVHWQTRTVPNHSLPQWSVTAKKQLGPHSFEKTLVANQLGTPPVIICSSLERRACRELEHEIMFYRNLAEEGMTEAG